MSNIKQYILKRPATFDTRLFYGMQLWSEKDIFWKMPELEEEDIDDFFIELDVDATRKQFRDALEPEICYWQDTSDDTTEYWGEELLDRVVDRILEVTLGRKQ